MAQQFRRAAALTAELAAQSEREVSEVCTHPPGLLDEPAAERNVAPTTTDSPFLAKGGLLSSGHTFSVPRSRGARARSVARDVDAKSMVEVVLGFHVKDTGEDGVQMRQKLANMRPAALQQSRERWQKAREESAALPAQEKRKRGHSSEDKEAGDGKRQRSSRRSSSTK